ncbi:anti-phage dCTP deaminase [Vibrio sp. H11]|uniref:anti-phage dCTP deaminase n=1 Tax=Vibrio sp. H11 TaxID=2565928 RepID=UPI0010A5E91B|nr:anti-phage dCTP deaminase [Vibrio sp. H11]
MTENRKNPFDILVEQRSDFIVLGLTGRTGSGCTTASMLLSGKGKNFPSLESLTHVDGYKLSSLSQKRYSIAKFYAQKHFPSFLSIKISDLISAVILESSKKELINFISKVLCVEKSKVRTALDAINFKNRAKRIRRWEEIVSYWLKGTKMPSPTGRDIQKLLLKYKLFSKAFKTQLQLEFGEGAYTKLYQHAGNSLRMQGKLKPALEKSFDVNNLLEIPRVIDRVIKSVRRADKLIRRPTCIVIDAFRNPYEVRYFKDRYAAFYLMSINASNEDRVEYLTNVHKYTAQQIKDLDSKESGNWDLFHDRQQEDMSKAQKLFVQNVPACLELSDIHLYNPRKEPENHNALLAQLAWYISLMQHPGLITPTSMERVMHIAYSAKLNSGCVSRQVGAVITNRDYSVQAIGWNDVAEGQLPCNLRSLRDLNNNFDKVAYSVYERNNREFRHIAKEEYKKLKSLENEGINPTYCFKSLQNVVEGERNQVHTRSLHAEENAFMQLAKYGGTGIKGGKLFTTASPCELCAKKAYQLGIEQIVFIDPYPGIARDHILSIGMHQPTVTQFIGAVGDAYHRLYTPLMPMKDELSLRKN